MRRYHQTVLFVILLSLAVFAFAMEAISDREDRTASASLVASLQKREVSSLLTLEGMPSFTHLVSRYS